MGFYWGLTTNYSHGGFLNFPLGVPLPATLDGFMENPGLSVFSDDDCSPMT